MSTLEGLIEKFLDMHTIVGRDALTSVRVNGIFIPAKSIQRRLGKFVEPLVVHTGQEPFSVQCIGSATGISCRGNKVFVSTLHQLKGTQLSDVGIVRINQRSFLSNGGYSKFKDAGPYHDSDGSDLCAFDYTAAAYEHKDVAERFYDLTGDGLLSNSDQVVAYIAYGCPFRDQDYDIFDKGHLGLHVRSVTCSPTEPLFSDKALGSCITLSEMTYDPDGMSGGPVFATVMERGELILKFAGITCRAGNGFIHFIRAEAVWALLNASSASRE